MPDTRTLTLPLSMPIESEEERRAEDICPVDCVVEYTSHKAHRGYRSSLGVPEEPDEPAGVEIHSVRRLYTGGFVTDEEIGLDAIEKILLKSLNNE